MRYRNTSGRPVNAYGSEQPTGSGTHNGGEAGLRRPALPKRDYHAVVKEALAEVRSGTDSTRGGFERNGPTSQNEPSSVPAKPRSANKRAVRPIVAAIISVSPELGRRQCLDCGIATGLWIGKNGPFLKCTDRDCGRTQGISAACTQKALQLLAVSCRTCPGKLECVARGATSYLRCDSCSGAEGWNSLKKRLRAES